MRNLQFRNNILSLTAVFIAKGNRIQLRNYKFRRAGLLKLL